MKGFFGKLKFKPSDLKTSCESEGFAHKAKIVCFSLTMFAVANSYASYFNNLVFRSQVYQNHALAGDDGFEFMEYIDGSDPRTLWEEKNKLDVLEAKDFKELKFMHADWKDTEYVRKVPKSRDVSKLVQGGDSNNASDTQTNKEYYFEDEKVWSDANGNPLDNSYYFTQVQRMQGEDEQTKDRDLYQKRIEWSSKQYEEWNTMHDGTIWFDTAGCLKGQKIGEVNSAGIFPKTRSLEAKYWNYNSQEVKSTTFTNDSTGMRKQYEPVRKDVWTGSEYVRACDALDGNS